jgi:hypothetical protein
MITYARNCQDTFGIDPLVARECDDATGLVFQYKGYLFIN